MTASVRLFRSRRVLLPGGERAAGVLVRAGRIESVGAHGEPAPGAELIDVGDLALLPGLVDTHVHVNEPGRTEWEGFETATRAAAAGGVTTLVDMPLNSLPPVTDRAALEAKRQAAAGRVRVDVGFWGGAIPGNERGRDDLHAAGVFGFKAFLCDSGVPEFAPLDEADLARALEQVAALGSVLLVHAEWPACLGDACGRPPRQYASWLETRPPAAEVQAVERLLAAAERAGAQVHVVHLSAAESLEALAAARARGVRATVETCPHYLTLAAEEIPEGATIVKCAPPVREAANRDRLWEGLSGGAIDAVVSDHSPSPPEGKRLQEGDFLAAWGGIASLGLALPLVWTEASRRGVALSEVMGWMSAGPASLAGLERTKGAIAPGRDADLLVFDPDAEWTVDGTALHYRHPITPYAGRRLRGVVRATWLAGEPVYAEGTFPGPPRGRLLSRS